MDRKKITGLAIGRSRIKLIGDVKKMAFDKLKKDMKDTAKKADKGAKDIRKKTGAEAEKLRKKL